MRSQPSTECPKSYPNNPLSPSSVVPKLCLGMRPCEALLRAGPCRSQAPLGNASRQAPLGKTQTVSFPISAWECVQPCRSQALLGNASPRSSASQPKSPPQLRHHPQAQTPAPVGDCIRPERPTPAKAVEQRTENKLTVIAEFSVAPAAENIRDLRRTAGLPPPRSPAPQAPPKPCRSQAPLGNASREAPLRL